MTQEALKLALGQLQAGFPGNAMQILREALAQEQEPWCMKMNGCKTKCEDCPDEPPQRTEQEPLIGCVNHDCDKCKAQTQEPVQFKCTVIDDVHPNGIPLEQWTSPPQRTWVDLTDEEIQVVAKQARSKDHAVTLTNKLLKDKNT
jgi:hypothetical protein